MISKLTCLWNSYKILAPQIIDEEPNAKIATQKCLETTTLDPDFYRIGHTKARNSFDSFNVPCFMFQVYKISVNFSLRLLSCD